MKKLAFAIGASLLSLGIASGSVAAEERFITIGTGG